MSSTHDVSNQAPPLENYNLFDRNRPLIEAAEREGAAGASGWLAERGAELGSADMIALGVAANRNPPTPKLFDRTGRRCDEVEFHPAYHELMGYLKRHGASAGPWAHPVPGAHVKRAALLHDVRGDRGRHAVPDDDDLRGASRRSFATKRSRASGCRSSTRPTTTRASSRPRRSAA